MWQFTLVIRLNCGVLAMDAYSFVEASSNRITEISASSMETVNV